MPYEITHVEPKPVDFEDLQEGIMYRYVGSKFTTKYLRTGKCTIWLAEAYNNYPDGRIGTHTRIEKFYDGKFEPVPIGTTIRIEI